MEKEVLIKAIIDAAYQVHMSLPPGYVENVYQNAMLVELRSRGIDVVAETPLQVYYKDVVVGSYKADMIVEGDVLVELKAVNALTSAHEVQLVNYLTTTHIDDGLLINFGTEKIEVKRKYRKYMDLK